MVSGRCRAMHLGWYLFHSAEWGSAILPDNQAAIKKGGGKRQALN